MLTTQIGDKPHSLLYMTSKANHSSQNVCTDAWAKLPCGCPAFAVTLTQKQKKAALVTYRGVGQACSQKLVQSSQKQPCCQLLGSCKLE